MISFFELWCYNVFMDNYSEPKPWLQNTCGPLTNLCLTVDGKLLNFSSLEEAWDYCVSVGVNPEELMVEF